VGVRRAVGLRLTAEDVSPMVTGIARPVIHLPRKVVARLDADQLHAVLVHELHHVKSRDTWVALTQTIARILFFHHPAVWFVNAHLSRLREVATDRAVLSHPEIGRKAYCAALVETAAVMSGVRRFPRLALGVVETKSQLENRIAMNLHHPRLARAHLGLPALASVAVLALVLLPMAPGRIAGSDETRAAPMGFEPAGDATTITRVDATIASIVGAFNRRDREAYLAAFTEDAILLPNGAPHTSGLAGVAQMYLQAPAGLVYEPFSETNRAVYEIGDWVIETGLIGFQFRLMPEAPVMTDPRQYLTIWQRSGAGDALAVKLLAWNQLMDTTALTRDVPAVTFRARAPGGAFRKDGDFAAVRAAEMLFHEHFESGAAQGSVDLYADDALLIPLEALPIRGRDAIRAYIEQLPAEKQVKRIERQLVHTEGNGNYVLVVNLFRWTFEPVAGVPIPVAGKGVHIWERSPDGKWRVLFDLPNVSQQSR
jgi:ketosteroid isomerase-like protein